MDLVVKHRRTSVGETVAVDQLPAGKIIGLEGKIFLNINLNESIEETINVEDLATGMYQVEIISIDGGKHYTKMIKQ